MTNILKNPTLSGFTLRTYFTDSTGNTGAIEDPNDWEFVYDSLEDDPQRIAQSLHHPSGGFRIAAGYRKWEAGYVQRGVRLTGGQRYLAKANFFPDVNFNPGTAPDTSTVQWRFWIEGGGEHVELPWQGTNKGSYKNDEEVLFVFDAKADVTVDFFFKCRSIWASNTAEIWIKNLSLEPVAADYGGGDVPSIGSAATSPPATSPPAASSSPVAAGKGLGDVLSADEIATVVKGLRSMSQVTPNADVVTAFNKLADALERLK